jgi:hypothetical protein
MTKKDDRASNERLESQIGPPEQPSDSDPKPEQDYKVGPGRPPRNTQFKRGGPSPNPRGRPRKQDTMRLDAKKAFEQAINKKFRVSQADKKVFMTRIEAGLEQLLNQFAKGDRYARKDLMAYADKLGIDFLAAHKQTLEEALAPNLEAILHGYVARQISTGNLAPAEPVLAPPELLNDGPADAAAMPSSGEPRSLPAPVPPAPTTTQSTLTPRPVSREIQPASISMHAANAQPATLRAAPTRVSPAPAAATQSPSRVPSAPTSSGAAVKRQATAMSSQTAVKEQAAAMPGSEPKPASSQSSLVQAPAIRYPGLGPVPPSLTRPRPADPVPEPDVAYPKPFARMSWKEICAWYPQWCVEYKKWAAEQGIYI